MNIILGQDNATALADRYIVLELDTFCSLDLEEPVTAYYLMDTISSSDMPMLQQFCDMHQNLMMDYKTQQWARCLDSLEQLYGCWNGQLDEFYAIMRERIAELSQKTLAPDWNGQISK